MDNAAKSLNAQVVATNLTTEYAAEGLSFSAADITEWIAPSGDGVIGRFSFQVGDATPSSTFNLPPAAASQFAGVAVTVSSGTLTVNGVTSSGAVTFKVGDAVSVSPPPGAFPNGVDTVYMINGATHLAKVSFVKGLVSIAVTPSSPSLPLGLTQQFKATGTFSDATIADLTSTVAWQSATPTIATVNATTGAAMPLATGVVTIMATSGSVVGQAMLTVTAAALESLVITPSSLTTGVGFQNQLVVTGTYSDASTMVVTASALWSSSDGTIVSVGPTTGIVTSAAVGSTSITATLGSVTATVPLTVVRIHGLQPAACTQRAMSTRQLYCPMARCWLREDMSSRLAVCLARTLRFRCRYLDPNHRHEYRTRTIHGDAAS